MKFHRIKFLKIKIAPDSSPEAYLAFDLMQNTSATPFQFLRKVQKTANFEQKFQGWGTHPLPTPISLKFSEKTSEF